jgi:MFS family permease
VALIQEVWHIYILYFFIGLAAGFGGFIASTTIVNNWFVRNRSIAMGIFTACGGLGGFVFPPITTIRVQLQT